MTKKVVVPKGSHVVNPLIATADTRALIDFLGKVFHAKDLECCDLPFGSEWYRIRSYFSIFIAPE